MQGQVLARSLAKQAVHFCVIAGFYRRQKSKCWKNFIRKCGGCGVCLRWGFSLWSELYSARVAETTSVLPFLETSSPSGSSSEEIGKSRPCKL